MGEALQKAVDLILTGDRELVSILFVTARMSFCSSLAALLLGVPLGMLLGAKRFPGRRALVALNRTLMGVPPVVCGLIFYLLFSGVGPFRRLRLLFTVPAMVLAQITLITPLIVSELESYVAGIAPTVRETALGLGLGRFRIWTLMLGESAYQVASAYLMGFARSVAEVGAVSMVGGAIAWKTNVMTTAIMQYTNRGNFSLGIALGLILMGLSLAVNALVTLAQGRLRR